MGFWSKVFGAGDIPKVEKRTALNLRVGDIVTYDLVDYQVVGLIRYNDSGYSWVAYQLDGDGDRIWLAAEQDDELELGIYRTINLDLGPEPPRKLTYDGKTFILDEAGEAAITQVNGEAGAAAGQRIKYWDYEDQSGDYGLSVERWGSDMEVSLGQFIHPRELSFLAGS